MKLTSFKGLIGKGLTGLMLAAVLVGGGLMTAPSAHAQDAAPAASSAPADSTEAALPASSAPAAEAAAAPAPAMLPHQAALALDTGGAAWILTSTALVLLMTIPGLALF